MKPSHEDRWPSWKIQVTTPNDALIDTNPTTIALSGNTIEPNARNSMTSITPATSSPIHGRCAPTESTRSTVAALAPVTYAAASPPGVTSRIARATSWDAGDWASPIQWAVSSAAGCPSILASAPGVTA